MPWRAKVPSDASFSKRSSFADDEEALAERMGHEDVSIVH